MSDRVGRLFRLPAFVERRRMFVVPRPRSARRRRARRPWYLVAPLLVLLPPVAMSEEDDLLLLRTRAAAAATAAGEVEPPRADPRQAAERFVAWEGRTLRGTATDSVARADVAAGIALLADAVEAAGAGTSGSPSAEELEAMRWHGTQIAERVEGEQYGAYEDAGHARTAFVHAARLLGTLPESPGGVTEALALAAGVVDARPLSAQGVEVRRFFRRAATVLAVTASP